MLLTVLSMSVVIFGVAMLGLGAGLIIKNRPMAHSCCGGELCDDHARRECDHAEPCDDCPNRDDRVSEGV